MFPMPEKKVKLTEAAFINVLGFPPSECPELIVFSPIVSMKTLIRELAPLKIYQTIWSRSVLFESGGKRALFFKTAPGAYAHLELINFLTLRPVRHICFLGACGLLDDNIQKYRLFSIDRMALLDMAFPDFSTELRFLPPQLPSLSLPSVSALSTHLISLESEELLRQWKQLGIEAIDMEIGYIHAYCLNQGITFSPFVFGTDYPLQGETFLLKDEDIRGRLVLILAEFIELFRAIAHAPGP